MNYKYDVSVIIPVYNAQDYVEKCVLSLINQTYDTSKIEILLINDGSPDNSDEVCRKLKEQYPQIVYIAKDNSGVSDTRNVGIKIAQGKYIMLLDSDDYLAENTIENLIHFYDAHYEELELVTYPLMLDTDGKISLHPRYSESNYDKGTAIYDLDEYPYLNQSTVNIIFKNRFENNLLYDVTMKLSEDQNFDTELLMRTNKIGFVREASYYYRRYGGGVSQTRNNPYYCFEDIISYNEGLLKRYEKDGKVPKYVQALIANTFTWRIKSDQLLPYHYDKEEFEEAQKRISDVIDKLDNDVILQYSTGDLYIKWFLLKQKSVNYEAKVDEEGYYIVDEEENLILDENRITLNIYRNRMKADKISMFASFVSPLFDFYPIEEFYVEGKNRDGSSFVEKKSIKKSNVPYRSAKMKIAAEYPFEYIFSPEEVKSFRFYVKCKGVKFECNPVYYKYSGLIKKYNRNSIPLKKYYLECHEGFFKVTKRNPVTEASAELKTSLRYPKKNLLGITAFRLQAKQSKKVWLYYDAPGVIDNGYYQFIHDFEIKDGVEKYYVVDGNTSFLDGKLTAEQRKHLLKHKSKQHKELFLKAQKIFVSFASPSIYLPFGNISWYADLLQYELIYLQHGVLHASLQNMYAKEYTQIDKFVISSKFEYDNLIENYDYSPDDFIISGMPRMGLAEEQVEVKNKILLAPSWRQYLIGQLVNNKRTLMDNAFLESTYFKEMNDFLHSEKLQQLLEKHNLELEFKLHPIFKEYKKHFDVECVDRVDINFDKTVLGEYKMFITDFSSFQFDFVKYVRPIAYFLPDEKEMRAGIHSYKELDLKYEEAFGKLCLTSDQLLEELEKAIQSVFAVEEPYKTRMEEFFCISGNPVDTIYEAVTKEV